MDIDIFTTIGLLCWIITIKFNLCRPWVIPLMSWISSGYHLIICCLYGRRGLETWSAAKIQAQSTVSSAEMSTYDSELINMDVTESEWRKMGLFVTLCTYSWKKKNIFISILHKDCNIGLHCISYKQLWYCTWLQDWMFQKNMKWDIGHTLY